MTSEQKTLVQNMRSKLYGYAEIADALGLPVNTIKSYCYRNRLNTEELLKDVTPCKNCGKPILLSHNQKPNLVFSVAMPARFPGGRITKKNTRKQVRAIPHIE